MVGMYILLYYNTTIQFKCMYVYISMCTAILCKPDSVY